MAHRREMLSGERRQFVDEGHAREKTFQSECQIGETIINSGLIFEVNMTVSYEDSEISPQGRCIGRMRTLASACVLLVAATAPGLSSAKSFDIDWKKCVQPDLDEPAFKSEVDARYAELVKAAKQALPDKAVAVQLNRYYSDAVKQRRSLVANSYLDKEKRGPSGCAVTDGNYRKVLVLRDSVYRLLCRAEIAIGASDAERLALEAKVRAFTLVYEGLKMAQQNVAASDDPATPPGGAASCFRGITEGKSDPFPKAGATSTFSSHMSTCDALARLTPLLSADLKKKAVENDICTKEGG